MHNPLVLLPALALAACGVADAGTGDTGSRTVRSYPLAGFTAVAAAGSEAVDVRVGPAFSVRAEGPQAALDRLDLRVEGGALRIGHKPGTWRWGSGSNARIMVTMPAIAGAVLAGSGDMTVDRAAGDHFEGTVSGSGNLTVGAIAARRLDFHLAGSGNVVAGGRADRADYSVAGSGNIDARRLTAGSLAVSIAGSGGVDARATSPVKVSIVGSGDVTVAGAPCTVSKVGSGSARCG